MIFRDTYPDEPYIPFSPTTIQNRSKIFSILQSELSSEDFLVVLNAVLANEPFLFLCIPHVQEIFDIRVRCFLDDSEEK